MHLLRALGPLLLLGPGLALHLWLQPRRRWIDVPLLAAATWVVLFWWLRLLPGTWGAPVVLLSLLGWSAAALLALRARVLPDAGSALLLALAALLCAGAAAGAFVPPGVDAAMHAAVARVLLDAGGHPASWRPLWPIDSFHSYPVGQPTLTALWALLSGDLRAAAGAGAALPFGLALCASASAVSRVLGTAAAGRESGSGETLPPAPWERLAAEALGLWVGFGAVLVARAPLRFWTWGGAPNTLGAAFALAAFACGAEGLARAPGRSARPPLLVCALLSAAALLTHAVATVALAYAAAPLLLGWLALRRFRPDALRAALALAAAGVGALLLAGPYLAALQPVLSAGERAWTHTSAAAFTGGSLGGAPNLVPRVLHDLPLLAAAAAALWLSWKAPRRLALPLGLAACLLLLVFNGIGSWLPLSFALYPERVAALLLFPCALLCGEALLLADLRALRPRALPLAALAGLAFHAADLRAKDLRDGRSLALATPADGRLLARLDARLPRGCTVATNYGDAGQWLPALHGRPASFSEVHTLFFDEAAGKVHPCAAVRGEVRPYGADTVGPLCAAPGACRPIDAEGGAQAWEITDPALEVELGRH